MLIKSKKRLYIYILGKEKKSVDQQTSSILNNNYQNNNSLKVVHKKGT